MGKLVLYRFSDRKSPLLKIVAILSQWELLWQFLRRVETEMSLLQGKIVGSIASFTAALASDPQNLAEHNLWQDSTRDATRVEKALGAPSLRFATPGLATAEAGPLTSD